MSERTFSAQDVQSLRRATGAGMLDAKRALEESGGDFEAAARRLRELGKASAVKRAERESSQGALSLVVEGGVGAIVELRCETDFVAKSAEFVQLVEELAGGLAADGPDALAARGEDIEKLGVVLKEHIELGRTVRFAAGASGNVIDGYLHEQNGRGVNAVLVELAGGSRSLAHELAVHIAFARPVGLRRDELPVAELEEERATLLAAARNEGKPEAALEKVVEGRLTGWIKERCLLEQPYVRDEKRTVAEHLGAANVVRFAQVEIGA